MKYSNKFISDYNWYLSVSGIFNFDGRIEYYDKKGRNVVVFDANGVSAKEAFYIWDSEGVVKPTKEPNELRKVLKTKGSINLHIKMYAEDRAGGLLGRDEFNEMAKSLNAPQWFIDAVERQKTNYGIYLKNK